MTTPCLRPRCWSPSTARSARTTCSSGSPSFEIPRTVERDRRFDHLREGDELRRNLRTKNRHNTVTMGLFLLSRWIYVLALTVLASSAVVLHSDLGAVSAAAALVLALPFTIAFAALVEHAGAGFRRLRPRYCSIYQNDFWRHERYWKMSARLPRTLDGTAFKGLAWRAYAVRIGRRVFDDGCNIVDKSLATIGDARCPQRRLRDPAALAGGRHVQGRPDYDRLGVHRRDQRPGALRRHHGRRVEASAPTRS